MTMNALPTGTITFLFTDIEGSTQAWEAHPEPMRVALARHDTLLRDAIENAGGVVFKTVGDGFYAAFVSPPDALAAVTSAQNAFQREPWPEETPLRVRMALHTGVAELRDGDYYGTVLNRTDRLLATGDGGQILVSAATYELVRDHLPNEVGLRDLGEHRLKDLERPEHIFQVTHPGLADNFPPLRSLDNSPNNLPQQLTSFIGREKPIADVTTLLRKTRLLTLLGSGGAGKTRLSLQIAAEVLEEYEEGAWLIELAPLSDPSLVPQTVASVLSIKEQVGQTVTQTLAEQLKNKRFLLVLDNCEHVVAACASLVASLLRACPHLWVLATSREPLGIAGEQTYRVPSLSLPNASQAHSATPDSLSQFEAVRLFIERAQAVKPDFAVTNANAPALAQLCFQLDGIPLALELAAARVRSLSVEDINTRLSSRFRLLTGGDRSALPRQQTLRALVDWSYDLLTEPEKTVFGRLSVFAGGWTLAAAESVSGFDPIEEWEMLDYLTSLADKSLVIAEEDEGATRYRMLETLRQYGAEKLTGSGEAAEAQKRHLNYFVAFAEGAEPKLAGPEQLVWLNRLETEHDNMRAAMEFCAAAIPTENNEETQTVGLRLAGALWRYWYVRGYLGEGREQIARALHGNQKAEGQNQPQKPAQGARAKALNGAGNLAVSQGDYTAAWLLLEESLVTRRELGDKNGIAASLNNLGNVANNQGDYAAARSLYEEGLALYRELGDQWGIASSLNNLGLVADNQNDFATARALHEESLLLRRALGDKNGIASSLNNLGNVANNQGDYAAARSLFEESLVLYRELGGKYVITATLEGFTSLFLHTAAFRAVAVLWGASDALRNQIGAPRSPHEQAANMAKWDRARLELGEAVFAAAREEGSTLSMEQAIEFALKNNDKEQV